MDDFATLKPEDRRAVFEQAALPLNMQAQILEKDFWVCWTLKELFRKGSLRITPPEHRVRALREDYAKMQPMFFGEPPKFEAVLARLAEWEREFNQQ